MKINVKRKGDKLHVLVAFKEIMYKGGRNRKVWRTADVLQHLKANYPQYTIASTIKAGYASNFEPEKRRVEWIFKLTPRPRKNIKRPKPPPPAQVAPVQVHRPQPSTQTAPKKIRRRPQYPEKDMKGNE